MNKYILGMSELVVRDGIPLGTGGLPTPALARRCKCPPHNLLDCQPDAHQDNSQSQSAGRVEGA